MRLWKSSNFRIPSSSCERSSRMHTSLPFPATFVPFISIDLTSHAPLFPKVIFSTPLSTVTSSAVSLTLMPSACISDAEAFLAACLACLGVSLGPAVSLRPSVWSGVREAANPIHLTEPSRWRAITHCCRGSWSPLPSVRLNVCLSSICPFSKGTPQLCPAGTCGWSPTHCRSISWANKGAAARKAAKLVRNLVIVVND